MKNFFLFIFIVFSLSISFSAHALDSDGDGSPAGVDCDDDDPARYPGAVDNTCDSVDQDCSGADGTTEVCDGVDNDCDLTVDEGVTTTYYPDSDDDDYGDEDDAGRAACAAPTGYVANHTDCDDDDADVSPAAAEQANDVDDDCDDVTDEGFTKTTYYIDFDADGYGDSATSTEAYTQPTGYVTDATDCDDSDATISPGDSELCSTVGIDDDCDDETDESDASDVSTWYADSDGDTYGDSETSQTACTQPTGYVSDNTDTDDTNASVYPGASDNGDDDGEQAAEASGCALSFSLFSPSMSSFFLMLMSFMTFGVVRKKKLIS